MNKRSACKLFPKMIQYSWISIVYLRICITVPVGAGAVFVIVYSDYIDI